MYPNGLRRSIHYGTAEPDEFSPAELVVYERELERLLDLKQGIKHV